MKATMNARIEGLAFSGRIIGIPEIERRLALITSPITIIMIANI
jgi:hypothetical protein